MLRLLVPEAKSSFSTSATFKPKERMEGEERERGEENKGEKGEEEKRRLSCMNPYNPLL